MKWQIADNLQITITGSYDFSQELRKHFKNFTNIKSPKRELFIQFKKVSPGDFQLSKDFEYNSKKKSIIFKKFRYSRLEFEKGFFKPNKKKKTITCDPDFAWAGLQLLLENIIRDILTEEGFMMVHSSCLEKNGEVFFFPAWCNTGKTTMILHMLEKGFNFMADDRILIHKSGKIFHYGIPINLLSYNLEKYPSVTKVPFYKKATSFIARAMKPFLKKPTFLNEAILFVLQEKFEFRTSLHFNEIFKKSSLTESANPKKVYFLTRRTTKKLSQQKISVDQAAQLAESVYYFEWESNWLRWLGGISYFEYSALDYQKNLAQKRIKNAKSFFKNKDLYELFVYPNFDAKNLLSLLNKR